MSAEGNVEGRYPAPPQLGETSARGVRAGGDAASRENRFLTGLRGRLLALFAAFAIAAVAIAYPILAGSFRNRWLQEHAQAAEIAALAVEAAPDGRVSKELSRELLDRARVVAVAVVGEDFRELVLAPSVAVDGPLVTIDLRRESMMTSGPGALSHLFAPPGRFIRILVTPSFTTDMEMEVIVPEDALRAELSRFLRDLLFATLAVALFGSAVLFVAIYALVVRPMRALTQAVVRFSEAPEAADADFSQGGAYEVKRAAEALQAMQRAVSSAFRERKRLADLGEAVAKINHDLRNSLSSAQLVSEGLSVSDDPRVRRAAPRLERALKRAISLAEDTLKYGRTNPPEPALQILDPEPVILEAASEGVSSWNDIDVKAPEPSGLKVKADPDHLHRILANLARNAARAISEAPDRAKPGLIEFTVERTLKGVAITVKDNGPGVPERVASRLFQPFANGGSRDGSGLGLAIARELARGMKGELELAGNGPDGACFRLTLPAG